MSETATPTTAPRPRDRWRSLRPGTRALILAVVAIVIVELGLAALDAATRGSQPSGPTSSSLSTSRSGLGAYSELLARYGHAVSSQRGSLARAHLDPATTLVLLDPDQIDRGDLANVRRFVLGGGHLIAGGTRPEWLLELAPAVLAGWAPEGPRRVTVTDPASGTALNVATAGTGSWVEPGGVRTLVFRPDGDRDRVMLLADASPLQDRLLGTADNAAFGLSLAGERGRPVVFAEGVHGYGTATGIAAIPFRWKVALVAVALAALLAMVAGGRRLGPPEDDARRLPPPRRAYVDSVAETLARTHRPADALAPLQRAVRDELARRTGVDDPDAPDAASSLRRAATAAGWPEDEVDALYAPLDDADRVLAAGRALARVHHGALPAGGTERTVNR
jgi:hypothetical protein